MLSGSELGPSVQIRTSRTREGQLETVDRAVATEVPCTIEANGVELATLQCTPMHLRELAVGFVHSSGFATSLASIKSIDLDTRRWVVMVELTRAPDAAVLRKRIFTAGCGKGVVYADLAELSARRPLESEMRITSTAIAELSRWLQHCSELYRETGAVHTAALSVTGRIPEAAFDDIGRHNAVDKVIGAHLLQDLSFGNTALVCSGRTSSEILTKARKAGIAVTIARGAPTHQTVLRARQMGITVIGFARGGQFTIYSHPERVTI